MHDPKLVDVLARLICHKTMSDEALIGCRICEQDAREFFATYRLVQLPEEPEPWLVRDYVRLCDEMHARVVAVRRDESWYNLTPVEQVFHNAWPVLRAVISGVFEETTDDT